MLLLLFFHQFIVLIYKMSGLLLSNMLHHDHASGFFPQEAVECARQMFKHDFHPPAAGNLLLVLNVTSTYD